MKDDDWNPCFTRKKKRNRVSRGAPARARRYYFWPCAVLVAVTALFRLGVVGRLITLSGLNADKMVEMHVSFNSLTDGHSKWQAPDGRLLLGGTTHDDDIYECQVSQEFWERTQQNSHVTLPAKQCRVIDPTVTVSGSLPLSNGGYGNSTGNITITSNTYAGWGEIVPAAGERVYCTTDDPPKPQPPTKLGRKLDIITWAQDVACYVIESPVTDKTSLLSNRRNKVHTEALEANRNAR